MSDNTKAVDEFDLLRDDATEFEVPWTVSPLSVPRSTRPTATAR